MTPDEFEFWKMSYLAALAGLSVIDSMSQAEANLFAREAADMAVLSYRAAKATVVQTTYATGE